MLSGNTSTWIGFLAMMIAVFPREPVEARIESGDLNMHRTVLEGEWLQLKLGMMGLRLSYPAYRINLELDDKNTIVFTFLSSSGLSEHLVKVGPVEAEQMLKYHAEGIRHQVEQLVKNDFPNLWTSYDPESDFKGEFLVPSEDLETGPRQLAYWKNDRLYWSP